MSTYPSLAKAIIYGNLQAVKDQVEAGELINDYDEYGFTPLVEAVMFNKKDMVYFLLSQGADPNFASVTGYGPLHWACEIGDIELCEMLLAKGADPNSFSRYGQPVLVLPYLRDQESIKAALYKKGAQLSFAQDFIQAKLLAHRFELMGPVDIVTPNNHYIQLDMEGFFLEVTLSIIRRSLSRFKNSFAARHLRSYFPVFDVIIQALERASILIRYQHFSVDITQFLEPIKAQLQAPLQLLPVGYEGHAIALIRYQDILVKCDRGEWGRTQGPVIIYRMRKPQRFNEDFILNLLYQKQTGAQINEGIHRYLDLVPLTQLPIKTQVSGNCSWANTEVTVAVILFLSLMRGVEAPTPDGLIQAKQEALKTYQYWLSWDKETALAEFVQELGPASPQRKTVKLMQLAALIFQKLRVNRPRDRQLAERLLPYLMEPQYRYMLQSYKDYFYTEKHSAYGINLMKLIEAAGYHL